MNPEGLRHPRASAQPAAALLSGLDVESAPAELVALGGPLDVPTLVAAYRNGVFPWPPSEDDRSADRWARRVARSGAVPVLPGSTPEAGLVPWCSPDPRAVLLPARLRVPRSLRQRLRRCGWTTTLDAAFADVVAGCAARESTWITTAMARAYADLHRAGVAHSVEVWEGDELVGGLYGVLIGQVFSGESMFHRRSDASKVAVVDLCLRLRDAGVQVLDTQEASSHLAPLGQVLVRRSDYLAAVRALRDQPSDLQTDRRDAAELVAELSRASA